MTDTRRNKKPARATEAEPPRGKAVGMARSRSSEKQPRHHRSPPGGSDAPPLLDRLPSKKRKGRKNDSRAPTGRRPLSPRKRRLVAVLNAVLAQKGISHREAGRLADVDEGDACRVLAFGPATPRTLRKLFETFKISGHKKLSAAERREALLLEIQAAAERQADLLGDLAALCAGDDPPF